MVSSQLLPSHAVNPVLNSGIRDRDYSRPLNMAIVVNCHCYVIPNMVISIMEFHIHNSKTICQLSYGIYIYLHIFQVSRMYISINTKQESIGIYNESHVMKDIEGDAETGIFR